VSSWGEAGTAGRAPDSPNPTADPASVRQEGTLLSYTPKHAALKQPSLVGRRTAGVVMVSAATVGGGLITAGAAQAASPYNVWDRVASCESGNNWSIATGNGYYGGLQFSASTWRGFGGTRFAPTANRATRDQQIFIAQATLRAQGPGAWPVCSKKGGLTRANGAAVAVNTGGSSSTAPPSRSKPRPVASSSSRKLAVDGSFGPNTTRAVQRWVGVAQTGSMSYNTRTALQRKVGVRADGDIGPKTIAALQARIGTYRDGSSRLNSRTVRALQSYLNANLS